jgi:hypothetical protein
MKRKRTVDLFAVCRKRFASLSARDQVVIVNFLRGGYCVTHRNVYPDCVVVPITVPTHRTLTPLSWFYDLALRQCFLFERR